MERKHGSSVPQKKEVGIWGGIPVTNVVSIPQVLKTVKLPVIGCP